jgi:ribose transport system ATP-binding protein
VVLEVKGVTDGGRRVKPCSFQLHRGEVLGIAGLVGSGRTELARLIYGADPKAGRRGPARRQAARAVTPKDSLDAGLAYLTEDRSGSGCSSTCRAARTSTSA